MKINIYLIGICLLITACQSSYQENTQQQKGKLLASVADYSLYESDLKGLTAAGIPAKDSAEITQSYVQKWIKKMLWVNEAEQKLNQQTKNQIDDKLKDYQADLWIHALEEQHISQNLEKEVSNKEMQDFYQENAADFILKNPIIKASWVIMPKTNEEKETLKSLLKSNKTEDYQKLKEYCIKFAQSYQINDSTWYNLDEVLRVRGFAETQNKTQFLIKNNVLEQNNEDNTQYLLIIDVKQESTAAPFEFVKPRIKTQILNKIKIQLLQDLEKKLFEKAQKQKTFKIYE